jgi:uncharacterized protein YbjT (DUF2867 family)
MAYKAVVIGARGLIGSKLLNILWQWSEYNEIVSLGRKKVNLKNKKLLQYIVDLDNIENYEDLITGRAVFCCLSVNPDNIKVQKTIYHDYAVKLAAIARRNNVEQFHLVSTIDADKSSANPHLKMKGEIEEAIKAIGLDCLHIYQPSILTGYKVGRPLAEQLTIGIMNIINPVLFGPLKKYRSIPAFCVAMSMYKESLKNKEGVFIHPSDKIKRL